MEDTEDTPLVIPKWTLLIDRIENGYILTDQDGRLWVIEEEEDDYLKVHETLLWYIVNHFNFGGTKHDPERIRIVREKPE